MARTALPPVLAERVAQWSQARLARRDETVAKILPLAKFGPAAYVAFHIDDDSIDNVPRKVEGMRPTITERRFKELRQQAAAIVEAHTAGEAALAREAMTLQREIGRAIGSGGPAVSEAAFVAALRAAEQNAAAAGYAQYRTAVLEPGLSPVQRRLLFSAALQQLALPRRTVTCSRWGGKGRCRTKWWPGRMRWEEGNGRPSRTVCPVATAGRWRPIYAHLFRAPASYSR